MKESATVDDALTEALALAGSRHAERSAVEASRYRAVEEARRLAMAAPAALVGEHVQVQMDRAEAAHRALIAELATRLRVSEAHASALVDEARLLVNDLPATLRALADGALSPEHARLVVRGALDVPAEVRGRFDEEAATIAVACTPPQLRRALRSLRERLHPQTLSERHRDCARRRALWVEGLDDGMAILHLYTAAPDVLGAMDRIDRAARSLADLPDEERTLGQLRADIAAALLVDGETSAEGDGTSMPAGVRAEVAVTVPALTLLGRSDQPAVLDGYGPVDPETARRLAAGAPSFTRLLTHPESGAVLSVGRDSYRVPADLRRHLQHRDGTCRFPGCTRSTRHADVDHTNDWHHGGTTSVDNLAHLCRHHHRLRHTTGWTHRQEPDGTLHWTSPTGRQHVTRPGEPGNGTEGGHDPTGTGGP
ncbi:HNH endonuclease [Rathayibacter sp. AY1B7]|uniref:HNH endonuclease signature motif containing protein n=1 Tax=Rathayibacter sp. AY1B7 TaxID=2080532 RepID=UPI000CE75A46|nr:HNH endonuclease signature motif containing protein [Rathayibacter sp. AY1B7]PPI02204.1 HNH endonuclease [Rathayibacter sp. AY1B7]